MIKGQKVCPYCGKTYTPRQPNQKTCGAIECSNERNRIKALAAYHKKRGNAKPVILQKFCKECGKAFTTSNAKKIFCNRVCAYLYHQKLKQTLVHDGPFYVVHPPEDYDWDDYGMSEYNNYLDKVDDECLPWYQCRNSIQMSIDPYPV